MTAMIVAKQHENQDGPAIKPGRTFLLKTATINGPNYSVERLKDYRAATRSRRVSISLSSIDLGSSDEPRFSSTSARARLSMAGIIA